MIVGDIMTKKVVTIDMDDTLGSAKKIFESTIYHFLPVTENNKLFGVLMDRDVYKALSHKLGAADERPQDTATLTKKVHQVMTRQPIMITKETSINQAAHIILENSVSCLPVIADDGEIVGIVTWKDIFKKFLMLSTKEKHSS